MKLALFGYGGHAKEVACQMGKEVTFFVDDEYSNNIAKPISTFNPKEYMMIVAVADSKDRARVINKLPKETKYFTFIHPSAHIMDDNIEIGYGSFIGANSILTTNIKLGNHTLLNRGNHIGHDTIAGDFFSMMPCAVIGGNVTLGDNVYLGSCSNVREKIYVNSNVVIGMNAAVVKDIKTPGVYVGVPAKKIK
jgi:sugar O-acyltransferase (sialic acid O-acetyltransferase NeuD family)|tara:strand:- start:1245 stop:1823 length:579 start_codon:yes stop_codon:yes gene_type:complete